MARRLVVEARPETKRFVVVALVVVELPEMVTLPVTWRAARLLSEMEPMRTFLVSPLITKAGVEKLVEPVESEGVSSKPAETFCWAPTIQL